MRDLRETETDEAAHELVRCVVSDRVPGNTVDSIGHSVTQFLDKELRKPCPRSEWKSVLEELLELKICETDQTVADLVSTVEGFYGSVVASRIVRMLVLLSDAHHRLLVRDLMAENIPLEDFLSDTLSDWGEDDEDRSAPARSPTYDKSRQKGPLERASPAVKESLDLDSVRHHCDIALGMKKNVGESLEGIIREAMVSLSGSFGNVIIERNGVVEVSRNLPIGHAERSVLMWFANVAHGVYQLELLAAQGNEQASISELLHGYLPTLRFRLAGVLDTRPKTLLAARHEAEQFARRVQVVLDIIRRLQEEADSKCPLDVLADLNTRSHLSSAHVDVEVSSALMAILLGMYLQTLDDLCSSGVTLIDQPRPPEILRDSWNLALRCAKVVLNLQMLGLDLDDGSSQFGTYERLGLLGHVQAEEVTARNGSEKQEQSLSVFNATSNGLDVSDPLKRVPAAFTIQRSVESAIKTRFLELNADLIGILRDRQLLIPQLQRLRDAVFSPVVTQLDNPFDPPRGFERALLNESFLDALGDERRGNPPLSGWLPLQLEFIGDDELDAGSQMRLWSLRLACTPSHGLEHVIAPELVQNLSRILRLLLDLRRASLSARNAVTVTPRAKALRIEMLHVVTCIEAYLMGPVANGVFSAELIKELTSCETVDDIRAMLDSSASRCIESCFLSKRPAVYRAMSKILRAALLLGYEGDMIDVSAIEEVQHCARFLLKSLAVLARSSDPSSALYRELYCRLDFNQYYSTRIPDLLEMSG
mmetsp:Transcript_29885/g.114732  ORF Transcript_29885/g.114732 Transcript_29885/m.114732 type:complete len:763 (-) Transcript_29885:2068-4356(-)|eukprot:CAMPEP_0113954808 /NCGR_PEP_ID=MMETSP0011_2-20120614/849_1 /TAXON_ID=101924 /ORGANISM="Rhodosorus marinus" /LENGTH=762 /DNA_ID=CAMNT_0000964159 /DNA_START=194 /DNA_END=2482 /DNA_ORIENTATION=- /assembly_acc=CAM_ASM_000156